MIIAQSKPSLDPSKLLSKFKMGDFMSDIIDIFIKQKVLGKFLHSLG